MKFKPIPILYSVTLSTALLGATAEAQQVAGGAADLPAREESRQRYQLSPGANVEVAFIQGPVEIEVANDDFAEAHIVRSAQTRADLERFDRIKIESTAAGLTLRGEDSKSDGIEVRHRVWLKLPRQSNLRLWDINGAVKLGELAGTVRLSDVNGGVEMKQAAEDLELTDINGDLSLDVTRIGQGGIRLTDINGVVALRLAHGLSADLVAEDLDHPPLLEAPQSELNKVGKASYRGRIGAGGAAIRIADVNGEVKIQ
jgi:DUF4097 and DUF4098 domain-containing protein YvlB